MALYEPDLDRLLHEEADVVRVTSAEERPALLSPRHVRSLLTDENIHRPRVEGVTRIPVVRSDGTLLVDPGYDASTKLIYCPSSDLVLPAIPLRPNKRQWKKSVRLLNEVFVDFVFDSEASRHNTLALFLTLVARPMIAGNVPAAVVTATNREPGRACWSTRLQPSPTGSRRRPPRCRILRQKCARG